MMKHRKAFAILAALVLLTATGCGANKENAASDAALTTAAPNALIQDNGDVEIAEEAEADLAGEAPAMADEAKSASIDAARGESAGAAAEYGEAYSYSSVLNGLDGASAEMPAMDAPVPAPDEPIIETRPGEVGVLTAGEWRDHENWGFFTNLVNTDLIQFPSFGLDPCHRISVTVTNAAGESVPNAKVTLLDSDGAPIWHSVSDKNGIAYLFEANGKTGATLTASLDGAEVSADVPANAESDSQGAPALCSDKAVALTLDTTPVALPNTQIMFIVDTTGSMGDEMLYLQSDFTAIAEEVGDAGTQYAALFYKDDGDEYTTHYEGFTNDVSLLKQRLNAERANGGGDEPEAVAQAMTEAFVTENWQDDAVKVAFLIYDAPPHNGREGELQTAIERASELGIHLVPVVSSNGSRETELFGRAAAICTNGSYVFLTDDSGIGGSHLEPIIGDHEVEKLHDIIVRIIQNYKQ